MDRPLPSVPGVAVAAIAVCLSICADAAPVEHVRTQDESASPAADPSAGADIDAMLALVNAARSSGAADPLALETALSA
jgi:hypothetical protein